MAKEISGRADELSKRLDKAVKEKAQKELVRIGHKYNLIFTLQSFRINIIQLLKMSEDSSARLRKLDVKEMTRLREDLKVIVTFKLSH